MGPLRSSFRDCGLAYVALFHSYCESTCNNLFSAQEIGELVHALRDLRVLRVEGSDSGQKSCLRPGVRQTFSCNIFHALLRNGCLVSDSFFSSRRHRAKGRQTIEQQEHLEAILGTCCSVSNTTNNSSIELTLCTFNDRESTNHL